MRSPTFSTDPVKIAPAGMGPELPWARLLRAGTLRVIYVPEPEGVFVITAYELTGKPLAAYRRRRRKKQQ